MTRIGRAFLRLFLVQGVWNYERMLGVGMGYAAEPLLDDLKAEDPGRHTEAVARSAEFFNANPNLAGLALGALVRAEYERVPGPQIIRLRNALCSPLGALGDQLYWAGLLPALVGLALTATVLGAGWWAVAGFLLVYNAARLWTGTWALRTGLATGMQVGSAIAHSWIQPAIAWVGPAAGFTVGLALPPAARWLVEPFGGLGLGGAAAVAAVGLLAVRRFGPRLTGVRFALVAVLVTLGIRLAIR